MGITLHNWHGIDKVPNSWIASVIREAQLRGWDADALLGHISSESGFDPSIRNPQPGQSATGLIQVTDETAKMLGFSNASEVGLLGLDEQLKKVVIPYFEKTGGGKPLRGADFKLLGFQGNPALIGADDSFTLYSDPRVVELNKAVDTDNDGVITAGDVRRFWNSFKARFSTFSFHPSNVKASKSSSSGAGIIFVLILAGASYIMFKKRSNKHVRN